MRKKPDYELKARVISSGKVKEYKKISRAIFADYWLKETGEIITSSMDFATALDKRSILLSDNPEEYRECKRVANANYEQVKRLKKRIKNMLETSQNCVFLTFTFTDEVLAKTSPQTRRTYVVRYLKEHSTEYVGNIDFGGKNGREHYHAVCNSRVNPKEWEYGALNVQIVRYNPDKPDVTKLAKYVSKLTNHAIKETTKRCALIYSRKVRAERSASLQAAARRKD